MVGHYLLLVGLRLQVPLRWMQDPELDCQGGMGPSGPSEPLGGPPPPAAGPPPQGGPPMNAEPGPGSSGGMGPLPPLGPPPPGGAGPPPGGPMINTGPGPGMPGGMGPPGPLGPIGSPSSGGFSQAGPGGVLPPTPMEPTLAKWQQQSGPSANVAMGPQTSQNVFGGGPGFGPSSVSAPQYPQSAYNGDAGFDPQSGPGPQPYQPDFGSGPGFGPPPPQAHRSLTLAFLLVLDPKLFNPDTTAAQVPQALLGWDHSHTAVALRMALSL